ncbi:hypothetical protein [Paraburkholderia bryophila]|uniref:PXPV repeat-containing protein n=1 Tax=Paraburkholderia bryophila TaxID=420952 RepID=A0A7Z0B2Q6_9BURK|nr:hypothetical protein [Paraburkholderia bryophila]NYH17795.1 hypothetical protein [Paraburkholderia bryophila]
MRKLMSLMLLAATAAAFVPAAAEAHSHSRVVCKRVWVHGRLVKRCRRVPPPRHYHPHRRPPPHHGPAPYHR